MALRKNTDYPRIEFLHTLAQGQLSSNEYMGIDYPSDMNPSMEQSFIQRSLENNQKYQNNPNYICGVQYKWLAYPDFEVQMKKLEPIYAGKKKIVGLGNLCRLLVARPKMSPSSDEYKYFKKVIEYIIRNKEKFYWIHIYGMSLYAIKSFIPLLQSYAPNIILSADNTKWTRCCNKKLKRKYVKNQVQTQLFSTQHFISGVGCTQATRNEFFLEYIKEMQHAHVQVEW